MLDRPIYSTLMKTFNEEIMSILK